MRWLLKHVTLYLLLVLVFSIKNSNGFGLSTSTTNEPSLWQKLSSWIFPFGKSYTSAEDEIISEPSNRINKFQRPLIFKPPNAVISTAYKTENQGSNQKVTEIDNKAFECSPCNKIPWIPILAAFPANDNNNYDNKPIKIQQITQRPIQLANAFTTVATIYGSPINKLTNDNKLNANTANQHSGIYGNNFFSNLPFSAYGPPSQSTSTTETPVNIVSSIPIFVSSGPPIYLRYTTTPYTPKIHKYLSNISTVQNITFTTKKPGRQPSRVTSLEYLPPRQTLPIENENRPKAPINIPNLSPSPVPPLYDAKPFSHNPYAIPDRDVKFIPVETQYSIQDPIPELSKQVNVVTSIPEFANLPAGTLEKVAQLLSSNGPHLQENNLSEIAYSTGDFENAITTTTEASVGTLKSVKLSTVLNGHSVPWRKDFYKEDVSLTTSTTNKPIKYRKKTQYIIPYVQQKPRPFRAKNIRKLVEETTTTKNDDEESDSQDPQESNIVTAKIVTPASVQKSTKYVAKILAASIKDLLLKERVINTTQISEKNVPLNISTRTLQDRIDKWTEEQFGGEHEIAHNKINSTQLFPSTKSIPYEYFTTSPLFPKVTVATVPPTTTSIPFTTKRSTIGSRHRLTDSESLDYLLINRLKTNFNIAKSYAENINYHNNRLWKALQVSISPITKEKVYIVTPQKPQKDYAADTSPTPRFSVRPKPATARS